MKRFSLAILALSMLAAPALAQSGKGKDQPAPPPATATEAPAKTKTLTMEEIDVNGKRISSGQGPISVKDASKFTSLLRIRRDYVDLILKSAEQI